MPVDFDSQLCQGEAAQTAALVAAGAAAEMRWRAVDLDAGPIAVRRRVGVVRDKGPGERLVEGATKTGQSHVVALDVGAVAALRVYRAVRGSLAPDLVQDTALVLGTLDGRHRQPERFSRQFPAWPMTDCGTRPREVGRRSEQARTGSIRSRRRKTGTSRRQWRARRIVRPRRVRRAVDRC